MSEDVVIAEQTGAVLRLSINRAAKRNALSLAVRQGLADGLARAAADASVRVVLITGEGPHFSAGADITELAVRTVEDAGWPTLQLGNVIESVGKPVIAELRGYTLGGAMEMALACTFRVGSDDLRWGFPEIELGVFPASGGTQRLPRIVGEARALELVLTGRQGDAEEALRLGLISACVPPDELRACSMALAERLAGLLPAAVRVATDAVRRASDMSRHDGLDYERRLYALLWAGERGTRSGVQEWVDQRAH
jgi:enoyl-CoA hydratase/carnithine racemase